MVTRCTEIPEEPAGGKAASVRGETYWVVGSLAGEPAFTLTRDLRDSGRAVVSLDADAEHLAGILRVKDTSQNVPQVALAHLCRLINDSGVAVVVRSVSVPDASAWAVIGETHLFVIQ